jgi:hypothetical protein
MKKIIFSIVIVFILIVGTFVYLEFDKKNNSFPTPEEALYNIEEPKLKVIEVIDKKIKKDNRLAYIFFYSEIDKSKDYIAIATIVKNQYGWQYADMSGLGKIDVNNIGNYTGKDKEYFIGFAPAKATKVKLGIYEAELISLEEQEVKIWFLQGISIDEFEENKLLFLDEEGTEVE